MLGVFARMLGLPIEAAEDAIKSEPLAQAALSRRGFLGGATALLCSGTTFGFISAEDAPLVGFTAHPLVGLLPHLMPLAIARSWVQ